MIDLDLNIVLPSVLVAIPATIAAAASLHNARKIRTNHGSTIGEHVENQGEAVAALTEDLAAHTAQDQRNFSEIRKALGIAAQDRADVKHDLDADNI